MNLEQAAVGVRVQLKTFHGTVEAAPDTDAQENYWVLLEERGLIVKLEPSGDPSRGKALVQFDRRLSELGLMNHNEMPNALWIDVSDLEKVE